MEIFSSLPTTPIGWFALVLVGALGGISFLSRVRANDLKILRQTNKDQGARIELLEKEVKELRAHMEMLEHQNKTLDDLVIIALKHYFIENPKVAAGMKQKVITE